MVKSIMQYEQITDLNQFQDGCQYWVRVKGYKNTIPKWQVLHCLKDGNGYLLDTRWITPANVIDTFNYFEIYGPIPEPQIPYVITTDVSK